MKFGKSLNERGATLVEISLAVSLVAVVIIGSVLSVKDNLRRDFKSVSSLIADPRLRKKPTLTAMEIPGSTPTPRVIPQIPVAPPPPPHTGG